MKVHESRLQNSVLERRVRAGDTDLKGRGKPIDWLKMFRRFDGLGAGGSIFYCELIPAIVMCNDFV